MKVIKFIKKLSEFFFSMSPYKKFIVNIMAPKERSNSPKLTQIIEF